MIPQATIRMSMASPMATPSMKGILIFVEYAIRARPMASTARAVTTESVITLAMRTTMTRRSFPSGAQLSILELYASASI